MVRIALAEYLLTKEGGEVSMILDKFQDLTEKWCKENKKELPPSGASLKNEMSFVFLAGYRAGRASK